MTSAIWRIFAVLKTTFLPKLADIKVTEDEVNINGSKHVKFQPVFKVGIILNE